MGHDHTMTDEIRTEDGFEFDGKFYAWHVTDCGKDLLLIDRLTGMPVDEFFEVIQDETGQRRAPILLALVATSIRAGNPSWTVDRIVRIVLDKPLSEIVMIEAEATGEGEQVPPGEGGKTPPEEPAPSASPAAESSPSSTPEGSTPSETL